MKASYLLWNLQQQCSKPTRQFQSVITGHGDIPMTVQAMKANCD